MKKSVSKKFGIVLLIFGLVVVIIAGSMIYFDEERKIKNEIEEANYCDVKSDCVDVEGKCPFGCYVFVNENESERIGNLIENYESGCTYSCVALESYDCVENKCVTNFDVPENQEGTYEIVVENLDIPWEIEFLNDGSLLVTERPGNLLRISLNSEEREVIEIEGVEHRGEGGLLGLTLHPDFENNNFIYLYFTSEVEGEIENRVERYEFDLDNNEIENREVIISGIPGASYHDGGRIDFGPDGYLYVTTGDAGNSELSQNVDSLAGKILRLTDEGEIPESNPFGNEIYSYGHRNPQGLAWDDENNLWITEHGRSGFASGFDELNLIEPGKNYGWPEIQGDENYENMEIPIIHSGSDYTWAPAGAVYYEENIYFAGLKGEALYRYDINEDEITRHFENEFGRLRAVVLHENYLYVSTSNTDGRGNVNEGDDKIIKIDLEDL